MSAHGEILKDWFPENMLADVLAGRDVVPDIGQVKGAWKRALDHEVRAGRLVKWRGYWHPTPGAPWGIGPLKTCYGRPEIRDLFASGKVGQMIVTRCFACWFLRYVLCREANDNELVLARTTTRAQ